MRFIKNILKEISFILLASIATLCVIVFTFDSNLSSGIYPIDADSISIPIFLNFIEIKTITVLMIIGSLLKRGKIVFLIFSVLMFFFAGGLSVLNSLDWAIPNHYLIAFVYGMLAAINGFYIYKACKVGIKIRCVNKGKAQ